MGRRRSISRHKSSVLLPPSADALGLRTLLLVVSLGSVLGMVFLFGGTRYWAAAPFIFPILVSTAGLFLLTYFRSDQNGRGLLLPKDYFFWLILLGYVACRALFFTPVPFETWTEGFLLTIAWLLYGCLSDLGNQKNAWSLTTFLLMIAGVAQASYAIILHVNDSRMVLWQIRPEQYEMRASGTFICPNHYAHFLQMVMIIAFVVLLTPKAKVWLKLFAGYTFILSAIPLVLSLSRSGIIGTFVGLAVVYLCKALRKGWKKITIALIGFTAVAGISGVALWNYAPIQARLDNDLTNNIRIMQVWPDTWAMVKGEGFWGAGPGTLAQTFDQYREKFSSSDLYLEYAHNEFLNTLAEYGWLISFLWLFAVVWMVILWLKKAVNTSSDQAAMIPIAMLGLTAGTFAHAVFDFNLHIPSNALLFIGLLGILYGQGLYSGVWERKPLSVLSTRIFCGTGFLLCLILIGFTLRLMMGSFYERRMEFSNTSEKFEAKYNYAEKMRAWTPWYWVGWTKLGLEYRKEAFWLRDPEQRQRKIDLSRDAYTEALHRNQLDKIALAGLMELARMENKPEEALRVVETLRELAPFDVRVRIQQGLILRELDRNQEALEVFQEAKRIKRGQDKQIDLNIKRLRQLLSQS